MHLTVSARLSNCFPRSLYLVSFISIIFLKESLRNSILSTSFASSPYLSFKIKYVQDICQLTFARFNELIGCFVICHVTMFPNKRYASSASWNATLTSKVFLSFGPAVDRALSNPFANASYLHQYICYLALDFSYFPNNKMLSLTIFSP